MGCVQRPNNQRGATSLRKVAYPFSLTKDVTVGTLVVATDGSGDYTTIQEAIDNLPTGGGVVYVKEGTYTITAVLSFPQGKVSVVGSGRSCIITTTNDINMIDIDKEDITIERITIDGNTTKANNNGIRLHTTGSDSAKSVIIETCWIINMGNHGIFIDDPDQPQGTLHGNYITGCQGSGFFSDSSNDPKHYVLSDNVIWNNVGDGVNWKLDQGQLSGNIIYGNANGIVLSGTALPSHWARGNVISGNICVNNTTKDITADANTQRNMFIGNVVTDDTDISVNSDLNYLFFNSTHDINDSYLPEISGFAFSSFVTFTDGDTTPTVKTNCIFKTANTGATSITAFDNGKLGQIIRIIFTDGNTTIVDGANLQLSGGVNFVGTANDTLILMYDGTSWYELSRSIN